MSLLPSDTDASPPEDANPRVVDVESDEADEVLAALSSETARSLLTELHENPSPPADLADAVDTSLQNVQYHLENLEDAGAIEVVDTAYSEKGREMSIYAPSDQPLVIFAGDEEESSTLRSALSRLLGAVGLLAVASAIVQALFGEELLPLGEGPGGDTDDSGGEDAGGGPVSDDGDADERVDDVADEDTADQQPGDDSEPVEDDAEQPGGEDSADGGDVPDGDADPGGVEEDLAPGGTENDTVDLANESAPDGVIDPDGLDAVLDFVLELPPGLVVFLTGLVLVALVAAVLYLRDRRSVKE